MTVLHAELFNRLTYSYGPPPSVDMARFDIQEKLLLFCINVHVIVTE